MSVKGVQPRCRLRVWAAVMLGTARVLAQPADSIEFSAIPPQVSPGAQFTLTIRGYGADGFLATNWQGQVRLSSFSATPTPPVISEADATGEAIEITNPGTAPADLSDWELQVLTDYGGITVPPNARLRIPVGTILPPQSAMIWTSRGVAPGAFPTFVSAKRFNLPSAYRLARIYNAAGRIIDEVYLRTAVAAPDDALWRGTGLSSFPTNVTFQRLGDANHFRSVDWATNLPTLGAVNPGLRLPWSFSGVWTAASPPTVQISNGVWTGVVTLPQPVVGTNFLKADDGAGVSGTSAPFQIISSPALVMNIPAALQPARESQAGQAGVITLSVPTAVATNLPVTLSLNDTNEFSVPLQVVIPAGTNAVLFSVTNYDDAIADGMARVTLTASAAGYSSATGTLLNEDDESGQLLVIVPTPLKEDSGFAPEPGWVFLNGPARHDVQVQLSADAPLEVPPSVIIPAGRLSQSFLVRVGDDQLVNPQGWEAKVRATTPDWPTAVATIRLTDDEDATFTVSLPTLVVEGTPANGQIQIKTAHAVDTVFTVTANTPRLQVPAQVILPAGAMTADFPIITPDNQQADFNVTGQVCVQTAGQPSQCKPITVADDEVNITGLTVGNVPGAVLGSRPFPFTASLVNVAGNAQRTNVSGQIDLLASPTMAQLAGVTNPIAFTNGFWSNSIAAQGEVLDVQLRVSAAGYQATSARFDILAGREVALTFNDAVWHASLGKFLVAEPAQTNAPARLTEIDPYTGARGRSLNLPRTARRIALSSNEQVAWLASQQSTLQRVDVANWSFDREFPVDLGTTNTDPRDLVVLAGETERVVAVVNVNNTGWRVMLFDHGLGATNYAALPGSVLSLLAVAGRTASEVFCQSFGFLSRFLISSNVVTLDRSVGITSASSELPSLMLGAEKLYRGSGEVFLPDTLEHDAPFPMQSSQLGLAFPDRGAALFIEYNGFLKSFDLTTRAARGSHALPASVGTPGRLLRWGVRGLASFTTAGTNLVIFETPLVTTNLPDLVVTANVPAVAFLPTGPGTIVNFFWQFTVTNRGAAPAPGAQLQLESGETFDFGTLAPGEGAAVSVERGSYYAAVLIQRATALCAVPDAAPQDNEVFAVTRVQKPDMLSAKQLILGMTHLIASPGRDRLYVSVAKSAGDLEDGVAVINPATASVEQMLPVGPSPQRLAVSEDGSRLYVLLGANKLVRWNLTTGTNDLALSFTNESVLDFVAVPGAATSVVVATTARITRFDDTLPRPASFNGAIDRRHLGYAGGQLWVAEPGQLRPFTLTASGLSAGSPTAFTLFSDYYQFASDGRYLYFSGAVFDTVSRQQVNNSFMGDQFWIEPGTDILFSGVGTCLRRYSLTTYTLLGEQCLPLASASYLLDPVRWGADGLAARCGGQQLLIVRSPLVPTNVVSDLSVIIVPPASPVPYDTLEWTVTLTNRSSQPALRTILSVSWGGFNDLQLEGPASWQAGSSLIYDLPELPAASAVTFKLRGWSFGGGQSVSASVIAAGVDATPADNSASVSILVDDLLADRGIHSVSAPARVPAGAEFEVTFVYTNAGPKAVMTTLLELIGHPALEFLGVAGNAYPTNEYGPLLGRIDPGQSKTAVLRYRAKGAGILPISAYAEGSSNDPQAGNNRGGTWTYAVPADTNQVVTELNFPGSILAWDWSRQQVLAAFPNDFWSLFVLNPVTLEPVSELPLPGLPEFLAACNDGVHAWVSLAGGAAVRVDLNALTVDPQFRFDPNQTSVRSIATPPGQATTLLAAIDWSVVRIFDNGVLRSGEYGPLGWPGGGVPMLFTPDGRLFLASSQILRELRLTPSGFSLVRNLDSAALYSGLSLSYATNRLFFSEGRVVNLDTGSVDDTLLSTAPLVADDETGVAYTAFGSRILWGGPPMIIRSFSADTLASRWRLELPLPSSDVAGVLPMGTNGAIIIGDKMWLVKPTQLGAPAVELAVVAAAPTNVDGVGINFAIPITVTNSRAWTAPETQLAVELSPGLVFADGTPGAGTNRVTLALGALNGGTNLVLQARAVTNGNFAIWVTATNALPDLVPSNNTQQLSLTVLPPPVFFLDSAGVLEGSASRPGSLVAWLSRSAPSALNASFTIQLLTAQTADFNALTGQFQFSPGQQKATSSVIRGDAVPELDESALFVLSSSNLTLASTSAVITIVNDDRPQITVTNVTVNEGNSGRTNANFRVTLSAKAPFPVEVLFCTTPLTATAGSDFIPREGWLRYEANEDLKTVAVPVIGDVDYEPSETATFILLDKVNADFASAQAVLTIRNDDLPPAPWVVLSQSPDRGLSIEFDTVFGATYQLQTKTNLTTDSWKLLPNSLTGSGQPGSFPLPPPNSAQGFYRILAR